MTDRSLTKDEKFIYDLIKHYSNKRPIAELGELVNFLDLKLRTNQNFTQIKIEKIIKSLIKSKHVLIGSKLVKENILQIPIRREIYNFIKENPGININELKRNLNIDVSEFFDKKLKLNKTIFLPYFLSGIREY